MIDDKIAQAPLSWLHLPTRLENQLHVNWGDKPYQQPIRTVGELYTSTPARLMRRPRIAGKSVATIKKAFLDRGLVWRLEEAINGAAQNSRREPHDRPHKKDQSAP